MYKNGKQAKFLRKGQFILLPLILLIILIVSTGMGYLSISAMEVIRILASRITGNLKLIKELDPVKSYVVINVRLPRILCAIMVGAGLSIAGVIFQGLLLNPLADPYTLGISAGAAFGAALAIVLNINLFGLYSLPFFAFAGAIGTLFFVIYLSSGEAQYSSNNLILSGIIVSTILFAGISFLKYLAHEKVATIIFWILGSLSSKNWNEVILLLFLFVFCLLISLFYARDLNIISLGERSAYSLGVDIKKVRLVLLITASLITAACVSVSGIIGFVGLIVPHLMRFIVGPDNRKLIPASALAGAILLLAADTITRTMLPTEIPIGVLTALIGGPFFCFIFKQRQLGRNNE